MDPVTMMIAAAATQAVGTIAAGHSASATAKYNAGVLDQQARQTLQVGAEREGVMRERTQQDAASQRVALLQSGVDPGTGSALVGVSQGYRDAEMDTLMARYETMLESRGQRMAAQQQRYQGKTAKRNAYLSAAGQLAGTASGYLGAKQAPAPVETRQLNFLR